MSQHARSERNERGHDSHESPPLRLVPADDANDDSTDKGASEPQDTHTLPVQSRYNESGDGAQTITVRGVPIGRLTVLYRITVIAGERAQEWEIRQAAALKEILLWHYRRRRTDRADRERPAA